MKTRKFSLAAVMGTAVLVLAGCGNNSTDQSNATNSATGAQPSIQNTINPVVVMTDAPVISNDAGTNLPTATNSVAAH